MLKNFNEFIRSYRIRSGQLPFLGLRPHRLFADPRWAVLWHVLASVLTWALGALLALFFDSGAEADQGAVCKMTVAG